MVLKPGTAWTVMAVGIALVVGSTVWRMQWGAQALRSEAELTALQRQPVPRASAVAPAEPPRDFVVALPDAPSLEPVARDLQRLCAELGATFVSIDAAPRPPTPRTLLRNEATIVLRGPYAALKSVLAQVLDRHANVLVQRVTLRRLAGTGEGVEAQVALTQVGRPKVTDAGAR